MVKRDFQVKIMLQVLLFLGGAGTGIGAWYGRTYLFEPELVAPQVESVQVTTYLHRQNRSGVAVVDVELDRVGGCGVRVVDEIGGILVEKGSPGVVANSWRFVLCNPHNLPDVKKWGPGRLPWWFEELIITTSDSHGTERQEVLRQD